MSVRQMFVLLVLFMSSSCAASHNPRDFSAWLEDFKEEARTQGISDTVLHDAFDTITEPNQAVIDLDRKQPEKVTVFSSYVAGFLKDKNVNEAKAQWHEHQQLLKDISKQYQVPAPIILALWSIESRYGERQGNFSVIESLTTLAYDGRRSQFFRSQLLDALKIIQQEKIPADSLIGSWAGAMGQTQFMPSSYLAMAVDFDGDNKRDIWQNNADALASIANYLHQKKWNENITWGMKVRLPESLTPPDTKTRLTLREWNDMGVKLANGNALAKNNDLARLVIIDKDVNSAYLVTPNYDVIMDWNRSVYFATTVGLLADAIERL